MNLWKQLATINSTPYFFLAIAVSTVLFVVVMALLHRTAPRVKKWLTIVLTFVAGLFYFLEFMWPVHTLKGGREGNFLTPYIDPVSNYVNFILIWTLFLGIISLTIVHGRRLLRRQSGWHNSLAFFLALIAMVAFGFATRSGSLGDPTKQVTLQITYDSLFTGLLMNLDSAMFALLAFYIASAAYRAFRVRTVEAALLMISALIIMLGVVSFGVKLTGWIPAEGTGWAYLRIENVALWMLKWLNMPGQRAVGIGVAIGALAMAMRIWLSLERGSFFSKES
jgi:hypothetical protein